MLTLTSEQKQFIDVALSGKNVLVDACIGSGKTTAIQHLCNVIPDNKHVLYLTYNKLLKLDAIKKITNKNVHVQNYHGYACERLLERGISVAQADLLREFNRRKMILPPVDILIVDEYQDIDSMSARMLQYIKQYYPGIQIIMVGDMQQKIYDYSTLDVWDFVKSFLGDHIDLRFTTCFRLSKEWAENLGKVWGKTIHGANENCKVYRMTVDETAEYLKQQEPKDILCLGPYRSKNNIGILLNELEDSLPEKFNKNTVYASIRDEDANVQPNDNCAIFTTYDSSKGLEKKICVLMDWTEEYWTMRSRRQHSYEILRNIFCVAASRGKETIIVVDHGTAELSWKTLGTKFEQKKQEKRFEPSKMFEFAKQEYIDGCYSCLSVESLNTKKGRTEIQINRTDGLIDISPCIGIYQEAMYFDNYNIDTTIDQYCKENKTPRLISNDASLFEKILYMTSLDTNQDRYRKQVKADSIVTKEQWNQISSRLNERLTRTENAQVPCNITCNGVGNIVGFADVVRDDTVYELKFTSALSRAYFLQCALYMIGLNKPKGILWNIRTNEIYEIKIRDKKEFLDTVVTIMSDGYCRSYCGPQWTKKDELDQKERLKELDDYSSDSLDSYDPQKYDNSKRYWLDQRLQRIAEAEAKNENQKDEKNTIAVIDTETTWNDVMRLKYGAKFMDAVFSIGIVIADKNTFDILKCAYYILTPECQENGMYVEKLNLAPNNITKQCTREDCVKDITMIFDKYNIHDIFAYNASFDYRHLPELHEYAWHDIMSKSAYRDSNQYLSSIDAQSFHANGRLKRGYGVEDVYRLINQDDYFVETHNALFDAMDELVIMQKLKHHPDTYCSLNKQIVKNTHRINNRQTNHVGEEMVMHCGAKAKIINYIDSKNIRIRFEDGAMKLCRYDKFTSGSVAHPNKN